MVSVPDDVIAAARIACASEWRTDRFIIPPLARPVLATPAIFTFMSASRVSLFATSEITGSTALTYGTRHAQETFHYYLSSTT
ncbi:MAG: ABC transporter permease subunit [Thermoanaerobaculia bacterium]